MKNAKLLAEKYLFNTAARYFENDETINEKRVNATLPDGRIIEVDDEDYEPLTTTHVKGIIDADEYLGDIDPEDRPAPVISKYTGAASKRSAKAKDTARFEANTATDNADFVALLPDIKRAFKAVVKAAIDQGAISLVGKGEDAAWEIVSDSAVKEMQHIVFKNIVAPNMHAFGAVRGRALRDAWEQFIDWRAKPKCASLRRLIRATAAEVGVNESFAKMLYKAINECLTEMYSEHYNVSLSEANKMFIVKDIL